MPHPFFDAPTYPWHLAAAQALHRALYQGQPTYARIVLAYQACGPNLPPLNQTSADIVWKDALDVLASAQLLRKLCEVILASPELRAAHDRVREVESLPDPLQEPLLAQDIVFVDRKRLRSELTKVSATNSPHRVLLVRGPSGSGKTWSQNLVADLTTALGCTCVYVFAGVVSTVEEVVEQLFTALGDGGAVPPQLETEDAWFRKVCVKLQDLAQRKSTTVWVVADDIGEYPDGPRLDPRIRRFFDQFALAMANPAFARWFRLVLLDYPDGKVPTRWRSFWVEDRPAIEDVTEEPVKEFLLGWARRNKKQLEAEKATAFAAEILQKASIEPDPQAPPRPRLQRINDELSTVLQRL